MDAVHYHYHCYCSCYYHMSDSILYTIMRRNRNDAYPPNMTKGNSTVVDNSPCMASYRLISLVSGKVANITAMIVNDDRVNSSMRLNNGVVYGCNSWWMINDNKCIMVNIIYLNDGNITNVISTYLMHNMIPYMDEEISYTNLDSASTLLCYGMQYHSEQYSTQ